jgi:hypothetical protein
MISFRMVNPNYTIFVNTGDEVRPTVTRNWNIVQPLYSVNALDTIRHNMSRITSSDLNVDHFELQQFTLWITKHYNSFCAWSKSAGRLHDVDRMIVQRCIVAYAVDGCAVHNVDCDCNPLTPGECVCAVTSLVHYMQKIVDVFQNIYEICGEKAIAEKLRAYCEHHIYDSLREGSIRTQAERAVVLHSAMKMLVGHTSVIHVLFMNTAVTRYAYSSHLY